MLVAISIPIFTQQYTKAQQAVDEYNLKAAEEELYSEYLDGDRIAGREYYYTPSGKITNNPSAGYKSKSKSKDGSYKAGALLSVWIDDKGAPHGEYKDETQSSTTENGNFIDTGSDDEEEES